MTVPLDVLKRALGIPEEDVDGDAELEAALARALAWVEGQTKRYFGAPVPRVEIVRGSGRRVLYLTGHIHTANGEPPQVVVRERVMAAGWNVVEDFDVVRNSLLRHFPFVWGAQADYELSYTDGFTRAPGDVEGLLIELVRMDHEASLGEAGIQSEGIGDYSYSLSSEAGTGGLLSDVARGTLNRWQRRFV